MPDDLDPAGFCEVLTTWEWWDCPRGGVTLIDGKPYRFTCNFDDALDDYPEEYRIWPIPDRQLDGELAFWRLFVEWRDKFDSGVHPDSLEQHPNYTRLKAGVQEYRHDPPGEARMAVPEWHLDHDRSFAGRVPRHLVRWTFKAPR